jgi:RNA polymerase sigma-70 factor (ECF subfamily)
MSFREFYDTHARFVWRVLLRIGVGENDLPDVVQDVFVVVHRKLPEFDGRAKVTTWLFAICVRVASDRRRLAHTRHELYPARMPSTPVGGELDGEADAGVLADRQRARSLLETILARMPPEQRLVFSLFELDGMTGDEIAELLAIPIGTVRSRLRLARQTFQQSVARLKAREEGRGGVALRAGGTRP